MIGDKDHPIGLSHIPRILTCVRGFLMKKMKEEIEGRDEGGFAAVFGTAVGRAVELATKGMPVEAAMNTAVAENVLKDGDEPRLRLIVARYFEDARNQPPFAEYGVVLPESMEMPVEIVVRGVYFRGMMDQVRRCSISGQLHVWDMKCSRYCGSDLVVDYGAQLCGYAAAAEAVFGEPVFTGGILRATGYEKKGDASTASVFYPLRVPNTVRDRVLESAAEMVLQFRQYPAQAPICPNKHCWCCPAEGLEHCIQYMDTLLLAMQPCEDPLRSIPDFSDLEF